MITVRLLKSSMLSLKIKMSKIFNDFFFFKRNPLECVCVCVLLIAYFSDKIDFF